LSSLDYLKLNHESRQIVKKMQQLRKQFLLLAALIALLKLTACGPSVYVSASPREQGNVYLSVTAEQDASCSVDWDDGSPEEDVRESGHQELYHHYAYTGQYTVRVKCGTFPFSTTAKTGFGVNSEPRPSSPWNVAGLIAALAALVTAIATIIRLLHKKRSEE
jgi:hypothetical protein